MTPVLFAGLPGVDDGFCIDDDEPEPVVEGAPLVPELEDEPLCAFRVP